ncbi:helix-turn-helix domain-containing protein [Sphingobium boeckii]|uniref:DNA-binding IclR family transcriptional regulator n=1 Tax=Sphingobium boeckii TaxID=1082345 RepID=A0A7W9AG14_9SPHN|nr:helix-turn-helix domain-containing protein [Sphingobium boeckii]MBB5685000.1 DNA-binding IclR family transcriptional regulator [Sphingobium boeckii]
MDGREHLTSLKRGLAVLSLLNRTAATVAQVAKVLDLPRTTAHRIVHTLVLESYVERIPNSRFYRLTPAINTLSGNFTDANWVSYIASPMLYEKTREIGWPLRLATRFGENMLVRVSTDQSTTLALDHFEVGFMRPIMRSSAGHVLLAFASAAYRASVLDLLRCSDDPLQTDACSEGHINLMIERVRSGGFEHIATARSAEANIGVPVFLEGHVVASLVVSYIQRALLPRDAEARLVPILQELAKDVETAVLVDKHRIRRAGTIN